MRRLQRSLVPTIRISITGLFLYALGAAVAASAILLPPRAAVPAPTVTAAAATSVDTGTIVLAPQDTFLNTNKKNYSSSTTLPVYTWPDYKVANTILMSFDLSSLPAGAVVTEATLHLALIANDAAAESTYTVTAHKVVGKNPNLVKATGFSADGLIPWTPNACCHGGAPLAQADISLPYATLEVDKVHEFKAWTLTAMVQEWLLHPGSNFGVMLNSDASKPRDRYREFASMEHANAALRPYLRVTFEAGDAEPPAVAVTAPSAGGEVAGLVSLTASASDNVGVAGVQFQLNGTPIGPEQAESPHVINWDSTGASDGMHSLTAVARDTSGNVATSSPVPVLVHNGMLVLSPQDTSLNINATNHSNDAVLMTYTWPDYQPANAILMKFDVSFVPPGAVVHEATLVLSLVESDLALLDTYTVAASKVIGRNPVVAQATGYLADAATNWTPNACCHDGVPLAQSDIAPPAAAVAVDAIPGFKSWTITTMVQEWVADPATNFGMLLNPDTSKVRDRHRFFASMEHPLPTLRPALRVRFSVQGDTTPPAVAIATPTGGQTLSNVASIAAMANDNVGVTGVQLHLDGAPLGAELTTAPHAASWDTRAVANGAHSLTAVARDAAGNSTVSDPVSVMVDNDTMAPAISGVSASGVTSSGATISWATNEPSDSQVEYGPTASYGMLSNLDGTFTGPHSVTLSGLGDAAQYHFRVRSRDQAGNLAMSADSTFTTADGTAPAVAVTSPAGGATVSGTLTVAAAASDNVGVAGVQFTLDGANLGAEDTSAPYSTSWDTTALAAGSHTLIAVARDAAGHSTVSNPVSVVVANDTTPPAVSGIAAAGVTTSGATISWTTNEAADTQVEYGPTTAYGQGTALNGAMVTAHSAPLAGLNNATQYHYRVRSRDQAGNLAISGNFTFTTLDGTAPAASVTAPAAGATVSGTITVTAGASDNVGVAGVQFKLDGANLGAEDTASPYSTSWNTGSATNGSHTLTAVARDAAGNTTQSAAVIVTVSNDLTPPAVSLTSPAPGATVSGTITVAAGASDNVGVAGVQFKLDGANLGVEDTTSPYSMSWNTAAVADGNHTLTATARDAAGNANTSTTLTVVVSNAPPPPSGGIAALYPGDVGIENNADVVFVERFDESTLTNLISRWTDVLNTSSMSFGTDVPAGSPVGKSLNVAWSAASTGGHLYRQLSTPVSDTLYVRYYVKHPASTAYNHTGVWMGGYNPATAWPNPQAGLKPAGNDRFSASAEQNNLTNRFDHYNYWMGMHQSNDGNYWGNLLLNSPAVQAPVNQWMCVEQMVKLNSPVTSANGEHAIWVNGVKVSHLGQGFPNGSWSGGIFTQDAGGAPFQGIQWRNSASLNLNWLWLQVYSTSGAGTFKYAHLVAAKSYIGCLTPAVPDVTPPTVSLTSPAGGATVSGTAAVNANAADNGAVVGVQFRLDGANLGAEDTSAPYSYNWNTTTATNGSYSLTAVARDAAGNSTTSTATTVNVSNTAPPPSGLWPNEPGGFTVIEETGWELGLLGAWYRIFQSGDKPINVGNITNSLLGETKTLQIDFPAGHEGGGGTELRFDIPSQERRNEIYVAYYVQVNPQWQGHDSAINKMVYLHDGGSQFGAMWYEMFGSGSSPLDLYVVNQSGSGPAGFHENVNQVTFNRGQWYRVEIYQKQGASNNGIVRVWVDGVLAIDRSDVDTRSTPVDNITISGIWGGVGDSKNQADYMRFDRIRISRPGS